MSPRKDLFIVWLAPGYYEIQIPKWNKTIHFLLET